MEEGINLHTKFKHYILAYYFATLKNFFRKGEFGKIYNLYYVDLFSGDGICRCSDKKIPPQAKEYLPDDFYEWYPPFFRLIDHAQETDVNLKCIFNDINPDYAAALEKRLREKVSNFDKYILEIGNEDANVFVDKALGKIPKPTFPSLFYLDPHNNKDLHFSTIKKISEFSVPDEGKKPGRKPELIVNLMIYPLLRAAQRGDHDEVTAALGTEDWKKEYDRYWANNKLHELFQDIFTKQLMSLGYSVTSFLIFNPRNRSPQYYLFLCTFDPNKVHDVHQKVAEHIDVLLEERWAKELAEISHVIQKLNPSDKTRQMQMGRWL